MGFNSGFKGLNTRHAKVIIVLRNMGKITFQHCRVTTGGSG